ncbi:MAG: hypothetical protein KDA37_05370 [Planctomycetales bacterium]|nr:hypothetical protein [Planctomycetales bacterium]
MAYAQTYFFVGPAGGSFFDEANWNDQADGLGTPLAGDPLQDSASNAIALDLIIDGDTVDAPGEVDFGTGSLTLLSGSQLTVSAAGADLDINSNSTFSMTDATLIVDDVANFEGVSSFSGGSVTSLFNDVAFQDVFVNLTIDGTSFTAADNIYFDGFVGAISNASFNSADRLGVRQSVAITMTSTDIVINSGLGDIDDVFAAAGAGSSLTLLGSSTLLADSVEEGAVLTLGGSTVANMGAQGSRITADGSTITMTSRDALLVVAQLDPLDVDYVDSRPFLINGLTGLSYAADPFSWNVSNWNGSDAVTLQVIPEPGSCILLAAGALLVIAPSVRRSRHTG